MWVSTSASVIRIVTIVHLLQFVANDVFSSTARLMQLSACTKEWTDVPISAVFSIFVIIEN
jgi:hypothetical protein